MRNRERIVIYCLLALLLAVNIPQLLGLAGQPALADAMAAWLDDLGPAASLTLLSEDEDVEKVVLRNRGGRLAWGDADHDIAHSVAYVHIGTILSQLMESETFTEDRQRMIDDLEEAEQEYTGRLNALTERMNELDPESSEAAELYEQGSAIYQEYMEWQEEAMTRRGALDAEQLEEAYRELIEAVEVVADREGIDTVYRFIPTGDPFDAKNPEQAMMAIRLRTALRYPEELDITDSVIEELSLEIE